MFRSKSSAANEPTVIGRGTVIEGTLRAQGRIQVDGRIEGTLEVQGEVSVGPSGSVLGQLVADQLAVGGAVQGKIHVREQLRVLSSGSVRGEVRYGTLQVDRGGVIDGTTTSGDAAEAAEVIEPVQLSAAVKAPAAPPPLAAGAQAVAR